MKPLRFWGIQAMVMMLLCGAMACSDDDDNVRSEEQKAEETMEASNTFWNVVGQLTSTVDVSTDYEGKTFQPTIGTTMDGNRTVRVVVTEDMASAAQHFANLVDVNDVNENTAIYEWKHDAVGKLIYTKTNDGLSLATVNVNIKAMPGLQEIVYRTVEQGGTNGTFEGTPYYRFGDVVTRTYIDKDDDNKQKTEYWLCVRPAVGPAGKEDSHWITVSPLPKKNIYSHVGKSNQIPYSVPKNIGKNENHMQNLAEMLYAIFYPDQWDANLTENTKKPKMWNDFRDKRMPLNNKWFFKCVANAWEKGGSMTEKRSSVPSTLFGYTQVQMKTSLERNGLNLLHSGHFWATLVSWYCTLYEANYRLDGTGTEANMHKVTFRNVKRDLEDIEDMDIYTQCTLAKPYLISKDFFDDKAPRFIIRHATGEDLCGKDPGVYNSLHTNTNGITDYYTYNQFYGIEVGRQNPPEECTEELYKQHVGIKDEVDDPNAVSNAIEGAGTYMIGDVVEDEEGSRWFCLVGSPKSPCYPAMQDNRAMFISFDNIKVEGNVATNIIKEDELMDVSARLIYLFNYLTGKSDAQNEQKLTPTSLGAIGEHIRQYSTVDLTKIFTFRDSIWHFFDNNDLVYYDSKSVNGFFNLAYNDGNKNRQAIARVIADNTQAGDYRGKCNTKSGKTLNHWLKRIYKHYEVYDTNNMVGPNEDEASVGMTLWHSLWAISNDKMYLDDVASQEMIDKYTAKDKWVRLPFSKNKNRGQPRTEAETSVRIEDYLWKNGDFATTKTTIFNEPVLFMRIMYVADSGNRIPDLVSTDGHQLKVVHMQNDQAFYINMIQALWATNFYLDCQGESCYWLDNQQYNVCEGWPEF